MPAHRLIALRFAPTTCLQLVIFEQVKVLYGLSKR